MIHLAPHALRIALTMLKISLILGTIAALANVAGGLVLVRARGVEPYLRYFVSLGAAFLMSAALLEMTPESLRLSPRLGPILIMAGYCVVHLLEHTINAHFHYGEETHRDAFVSARTGYSVLCGIAATGGVFGYMATQSNHDALLLCPKHYDCSQSALDAAKKRNTDATIANVGVGVGLAVVAASVVWIAAGGSSSSDRDTARITLQPAVAPGAAGLWAATRF